MLLHCSPCHGSRLAWVRVPPLLSSTWGRLLMTCRLSTAPCPDVEGGLEAGGAVCLPSSGSECTGVQGLLLPGVGAGQPYTLAVLPLPPPSAPDAPAASMSSRTGGDAASLQHVLSAGGPIHYELLVAARPLTPTFLTSH